MLQHFNLTGPVVFHFHKNESIALFKITASALDSAQDIVWLRGCFNKRDSNERTEPEAESKAEAVDSKRTYIGRMGPSLH